MQAQSRYVVTCLDDYRSQYYNERKGTCLTNEVLRRQEIFQSSDGYGTLHDSVALKRERLVRCLPRESVT